MNDITNPDGQRPADGPAASLPPGTAHASLRGVITDALRQAILSGRYKPGDRLVEDRLAADFAVSRNPIRESLRVLESEGLVDIAPRRGATVARLSEDEMLEIVELRAALEGLSARMAARRRTPDVSRRIAEILEEGARAETAGDDVTLSRLNAAFHDLLEEAGRNRFLAEFMRSLRDRTYWLYGSTQTWRARQSWQEHAAILNAIAEGDEEMAGILSSRHVTRAGLSQVPGTATEEANAGEDAVSAVLEESDTRVTSRSPRAVE